MMGNGPGKGPLWGLAKEGLVALGGWGLFLAADAAGFSMGVGGVIVLGGEATLAVGLLGLEAYACTFETQE